MIIATRRAMVILAVLVPIGCGFGSRVPGPRNIVLVTLDTTRADRLPAYGFVGVATPALDRIAREGIVFNHATSVAPLTLTAHTSLFTGLYPPHHGVRDNADPPLGSDRETLATILADRGFCTAAFVGSSVLGTDRGLARGFHVYDDGRAPGRRPPARRSGEHVVDDALGWLGSVGSSPFFLWVHLYDAHGPQAVPEAYRRLYADSYEAGIAFEDVQLGRLVEALDRQRQLDTTVLIVAGDHGESLGDHDENEHGIFVYESVLHVPMMIRTAGLRPTRVLAPVSLVDVLPTTLALLHLPTRQTDGASLRSVMEGRDDLTRPGVYAESMYPRRFGWSGLRALTDGRFKYIDAPRPELYDLEQDPFELEDLSSARPATVEAMRRHLQRLSASDGTFARTEVSQVTTELRARLRSLGYASGAPDPERNQQRDPKDFIEVYNAARQRGLR